MKKRTIDNIAYMTLTGSIPSRKADAVCVMNMCAALAGQGAGIELVIPRGQASELAALNHNGTIWDFYGLAERFPIRYLPSPFDRFGPDLKRNGYAFLALLYAAVSGKQLVNVRQIELALMAARLRMPCVFECHNFLKVSGSGSLARFVERMNKPRCRAAIVTTTQAGRAAFIAAGVPESRIAVLPNGVPVHLYAGAPPADELRRLLGLPCPATIACFSGSLYPGRGIENILCCAERFSDVCFLIVGGSPEEVERYRCAAQEKQLTNVHLTGYVPATQVPRYLSASDMLLMPNTSASSGHAIAYTSSMKIFDYLAAGRPIIASDFPVVREILAHGRNAVLVPPDSARALADGVQWVLDNPGAAAGMAGQARCDAQQFSWQKRAENYRAFVEAVL